ncbi:MAG: hypothetical protein QOJ76_2458 [Acidobacteriota bacterium]|nr:hypothetical protein [Acidobacteriota bacterium]
MRYLSRICLMIAAAILVGVAAAHEVKAQTVGPHDVLISEFRLSGPGGDSDEFVEFYCNRNTDCDISGYVMQGFDPGFGDFTITFPASGIVIPARQYMLVADETEYSLFDYAQPDFDVSAGFDFFIDNEGVQLLDDTETVVIDSVGFAGGGNEATYVEGTGLERATDVRPADQYAYVRKRGTATGGLPQDTDNNAGDFVLVSVTGAAHPGITAPPVLGAPGPQSLASPPTFDNTQVTGSLVEPVASSAASPNRVRTGSGNSGTLSIRRSVTNNTTETFDYLAFRVTDMTTLNSPNTLGAQAQLRLVTSGDAETFTNSQGRTVVIKGTVLQFDDGETQPDQPNGGGLNSSASVDVGVGLAPGETIDVQFLLNIVQTGTFRFYVNVEALTNSGVVVASPVTSSTRTARRVGPRRHVDLNRRYSLNPIFAPPSKSAKKKAAPTHILTSTPAARPTPTTRTTPTARETPAATPQGNAATRSNPDSAAPIRPTNSAVRKHD